ncbi:MAG: hypothetical protein JXB35_10115 [Anaerolineae bacterium]|nr:hypothetical protein [Anaerolineae bacterium]
MKIGTVVSQITPPVGIQLSGYAERVGVSTGIYDDLLLQTIALAQGETRALLIAADLIGFGDAFFADVSRIIQTRFAIPPENILLVASHTHSGPTIPYSFMDLDTLDQEYLSFLQVRILADAALALERLEGDYRLTVTQGRATFGVNRRKPNAQGEIEMLPNLAAPRDEQVLVVQLYDTTGPRRVILFNYACHADVLGSDNHMITAEYPGAARRFIENALPDALAVYLPGYAAEINPFVVDARGEFYGTYEDVLRLGRDLGEEVLRVLGTPSPTDLEPALVCRAAEATLPLGEIPPLEHFRRMADADHSQRPSWEPDWGVFARHLLADPDTHLRPFVPVRLTTWQLAAGVTLLGVGAEASVEYGLWIKAMFPDQVIVPVGYASGQIAYLSTHQQILEGGYESELGNVWYGHPAPFAPRSEDVLLNTIREFLRS